jgi:hypothetical protein
MALIAGGVWRYWPAATTTGTLQQSAYVWQRQWTDATARAVASATEFDTLLLLVAEVQPGDPARTTYPNVDWNAVKRSGRPAGLVVRMGRCTGPISPDQPMMQAARAAAESSIAQARAAGVRITEVQIDFDCPTRLLPEYARWLAQLRTLGVPLGITALPSWLDADGFDDVLLAVDEWVLQVHWLDPKSGELFVAASAQQAVERAAGHGRSFRVALPTYGYRLCRDKDGTVVDVVAEEPLRAEHPDHHPTEIIASANEISSLVKQWTHRRPAGMTGVVWFRLPVDGDVRNWSAETLRDVMQGKPCAAEVTARVVREASGVCTISVCNTGNAPGRWPREIRMEQEFLAADGVNGYILDEESLKMDFRDRPHLPAGRSVIVGWVRTDGKGIVHVAVTK